MHIAVCIKQVPDVAAVRIDRERMTVVREGIQNIINPLDYAALSIALRLRSRHGALLTAITMGPLQSEEALREALAAGADRGILLTDHCFAGADTLATSHVLARAISKLDPRPMMIFCGNNTIDSDTGHVGPQIAEELGIPQLCGISEVEIENDSSVVARRIQDGYVETLRISLPALFTVKKSNDPRSLPSLGALEDAFSGKTIIRWGREDLSLSVGEVGLEGSATRVWRLRQSPERRKGEILTGQAQTLVKELLCRLEAMSIIDEEKSHG
ncbi:MAG: electron transfer flavoprotein subunit beta/FixA family protein [Desulfobacteraceae bacterium]|jgi:electron transfer flavoprotein beta subunit|nr:MAG: electron transfer flavoprotein subunit beta/FixA family protein [Desulfobacteraceae bacterium]